MFAEVRRQFKDLVNAKAGHTLEVVIRTACAGVPIPHDEEVEPDNGRCMLISTGSSVKEMLASGIYAIVTPLIVDFMVGLRAVMGMRAGCIGSAAMLAVLLGNDGGGTRQGMRCG